MKMADNDIIREVLEEMEQEIRGEIQDKEKSLFGVKKEIYKANFDKDFKIFINDKGHRDIEIPYELYDEKDKLERELRVLTNRLRQFEEFKNQTENQLKG